jgi:mono/diheme cytochrome c family protein
MYLFYKLNFDCFIIKFFPGEFVMNFVKIALILSALVIFILACDQTPTVNNSANITANNAQAGNGNVSNSMPINGAQEVNENDLAAGRKIYMEICANCHKEEGTGGKRTIEDKTINAENFTSESAKKESDEEYMKYIKEGVPGEGMPAFKDKLNDDQIRNVIAFIRREFQGNKQ